MTWIVCAGIDRTGKSTLATHYKSLGYQVIHMSAPSKEYSTPGYTGPSYLDECLDMYMKYDGKDVFFDRTIYGELTWPHVYGRDPQLDDEAFDILREYEDRNDAQRILMCDSNVNAHWDRCVANKEPLTKSQFLLARKLYEKLVTDYGFSKLELPEFLEKHPTTNITSVVTSTTGAQMVVDMSNQPKPTEVSIPSVFGTVPDSSQQKLEKANAINSILCKQILKNKEPIFTQIETEIRGFLKNKLEVLLGNSQQNDFTPDEKTVLKLYAGRILEKQKETK